ncbi:hypothetical protein [Cereibacter sphaeroides]|uniref:hypothetical protein n=1 Tax=Cereibacter sphaeroides TaxID=1063 RepID=UPI000F5371BD|nr:hypothetical protein [Cereibacter sphaeroides]
MSNRKRRSFLSSNMSPKHKRMARMLGYCLVLDDVEAWTAFGVVACAKLAERERLSLAVAALATLPDDRIIEAASFCLGPTGAPLPPFLGGMDEARFWASCATRAELKAHALAAFEAMSPKDRLAFYRHICEVEIAA